MALWKLISLKHVDDSGDNFVRTLLGRNNPL